MKFRKKIINDPVYGFVSIRSELVFQLIDHPYLQRLRRIKQLGLTDLVYPGAMHTRFQHTLGALHLMNQAIQTLRSKGHAITDDEAEGVSVAILLHDIGHGPFSHALEKTLIEGLSHEELSLLFMKKLNQEFEGRLSLAIKIFKNEYEKKFLHQLVSSQLDVDRLDYLRRDSFFSGVSEGTIGIERIIQMFELVDDELVVESKGIYSVEKFLIARRLMYWQVYLHKTVLSAELMLMLVLKRAKELFQDGCYVPAGEALTYFLSQRFSPLENMSSEENPSELLCNFSKLDDADVVSAVKNWMSHPDFVLSHLAIGLINRKLFAVELSKTPFDIKRLEQLKMNVKNGLELNERFLDYFVFTDSVFNYAYTPNHKSIKIVNKEGCLKDLTEASDMLKMSMLSSEIKKYILCYPKAFKLD